uniref:Uncharacterized protein n=2 Tax=Aegilops tauschii subsp. strangulata TaxID=200361 RepID=A0A453GNX9_AEGTS
MRDAVWYGSGISRRGSVRKASSTPVCSLMKTFSSLTHAPTQLTSRGGVRGFCPGAAHGARQRLCLAIAQHRPAGWGSYLPSRPSAIGSMVPDCFLSDWIRGPTTQLRDLANESRSQRTRCMLSISPPSPSGRRRHAGLGRLPHLPP